MKRLLFCFLLLTAIPAFAQFGLVSGSPIVGTCKGGVQLGIDATNNQLYTCGYAQQWAIVAGGGGGGPIAINQLQNATAPGSLSNGSFGQTWQFSLVGATAQAGLAIGESAPSSNNNGASSLFAINTVTGSTVSPFQAYAHNGTGGLFVDPNGNVRVTGPVTFTVQSLAGTTSCLQADTNGVISRTGTACGAGGGGGATIAHVTNLIKGDGTGNGIDSGISASNIGTQPSGTGMVHSVSGAPNTYTTVADPAADTIFMGNDAGSTSAPLYKPGPSGGSNGCSGTGQAVTYNTSTHAWGCNTIAGSGPIYTNVSNTGVSEIGSLGTITAISGTGCSAGICTMTTPTVDGSYRFEFQIAEVAIGSGGTCTTGTVQVQLQFTDPLSGGTSVGYFGQTATNGPAPTTPVNSFAMVAVAPGASLVWGSTGKTFRAAGTTPIRFQVNQTALNNCTIATTFSVTVALFYLGY